MRMANIIFMGTSPFACACLDGLEQEQLLPSLIVTRPDSISGRNRRPTMPPVKKWALTRELETWQPGNINSNYHRCSDALTMQDQIEGDKRQLEKLSKLLNISTYDLSYYLDVDKTENFYAKYYKYVKYVLGETDKIN